MIPVLLKGLVTGGFSFLSSWWEGKQEQAKQELQLKQETLRVENQIKLKRVTAQLDNDAERIRQMDRSWKDEWWLILFSIPLVNMFISPFVDLYMAGKYETGMLANAASQALQNLDNAPTWYIVTILMMVFLSWGYRQGLDKVLGLFNFSKGK
ncbi:hypothetical protein [Vibrio phage RYC]|nr:hypothetical protein [Vibrio phage RYC]